MVASHRRVRWIGQKRSIRLDATYTLSIFVHSLWQMVAHKQCDGMEEQ